MKKTSETACCVLQLQLFPEPWQVNLIEKRFRILEHLKNSLIAMELRKLKNVERTRKYRSIQSALADKKTNEKEKKQLYKERKQILTEAGFSEFAFKNDMTPMQKHFSEHIATHVAHRAASDVWRAFDKLLYGSGSEVHFIRRGTLNSAANQQYGTTMSVTDGMFNWKGGRNKNSISLNVRVAEPETYYEREMLKKKIKYLRIVRKWGKREYKYYLQFTLEGNPVAKPRFIANGKRVGIDIGTSTAAIVSEKGVKLCQLAAGVQDNHKKKCDLQRKMDRSRRCMNPENYNKDGTIKRGIRLQWKQSGHYLKMQGQVRMLERKNADIRKYEHICLANEVLAMGTDVYIEQMSFKGLQRRAKETTYRKDGRPNSKKRFGKSLANRAPATFVEILDKKLQAIAGVPEHKVDTYSFKASQYDHTNDSYTKKLLKDRWAKLSNGDQIQRDLYSAFLLMNSTETMDKTDIEKCNVTYELFKKYHDECIAALKAEKGPHPSSFGIA